MTLVPPATLSLATGGKVKSSERAHQAVLDFIKESSPPPSSPAPTGGSSSGGGAGSSW